MIPCLYDAYETAYENNGIGKLADCQSCLVTEKRNGSFELKMQYPSDGIHAEDIKEENIILCKCADGARTQPFRIYKITTPLSGQLTVQARHISYQMNFITVSPCSADSAQEAVTALLKNTTTACPFTLQIDFTSTAAFKIAKPSALRSCLGGMEGSMIDVYGGELEWDRFTATLHHARGADHGVRIVYGKNLTDFQMEKSIENVITGLHPYWVNAETNEVLELPEKIVTLADADEPFYKIEARDFTETFETQPGITQLRNAANSFLSTTSLTEPDIDIMVDFTKLSETPGYEEIAEAEEVSLCDTVHVYISKLGIEVSSKVTETVYDSLLERYQSITLSNSLTSSRNRSLTASLNDIRADAVAAVEIASSAVVVASEQTIVAARKIIKDELLSYDQKLSETYATKEEQEQAKTDITDAAKKYTDEKLSDYVKSSDVSEYVTQSDVESLLEGYLSKENALDYLTSADLAKYLTKEDVDGLLDDYLTQEDVGDLLSDYLKQSDLPDYVTQSDFYAWQETLDSSYVSSDTYDKKVEELEASINDLKQQIADLQQKNDSQ